MELKSYLVHFQRPQDGEDDGITTVAILPADVEPTNELLFKETQKTLPFSFDDHELYLYGEYHKLENLTDFLEDVDCPPGCDHVHVRCYPEYRKEFDEIAPLYPDLWNGVKGAEEYPFGL